MECGFTLKRLSDMIRTHSLQCILKVTQETEKVCSWAYLLKNNQAQQFVKFVIPSTSRMHTQFVKACHKYNRKVVHHGISEDPLKRDCFKTNFSWTKSLNEVIKILVINKYLHFNSFFWSVYTFNPLSANFTKWSNTLKQFVNSLLTNCLSVSDHIKELVLKGLIYRKLIWSWSVQDVRLIVVHKPITNDGTVWTFFFFSFSVLFFYPFQKHLNAGRTSMIHPLEVTPPNQGIRVTLLTHVKHNKDSKIDPYGNTKNICKFWQPITSFYIRDD